MGSLFVIHQKTQNKKECSTRLSHLKAKLLHLVESNSVLKQQILWELFNIKLSTS